MRRAARAVRTFKGVADDFLKLHVTAKRKARTLDEYNFDAAKQIFLPPFFPCLPFKSGHIRAPQLSNALRA
jgi:hypothetical protein